MLNPGDGDIPLRGEISDFSRSGLRARFSLNSCFVDQPVQMKIYLPNRLSPILSACNIIWRDFADKESNMGLNIEKMASRDKCDILEYAYTLWREKANS